MTIKKRSVNLLFGLFILSMFFIASCAEVYDVCPAYSYEDVESNKITLTN